MSVEMRMIWFMFLYDYIKVPGLDDGANVRSKSSSEVLLCKQITVCTCCCLKSFYCSFQKVPLVIKKFITKELFKKSTHSDVRLSTLSKASMGRLFSPQF
jgi:hypothetical protein